ncbi:hypothetical protein E3N88_17038 [Mikania micrantha]|uniref:Uncharacterized protein n=1 Tax=Mikania micrantha TaxID=192012 RepID=A0A5N6NQN8_9ASTR|nr:hypothetical protein E3N88_17038 [Mikania micrantha]
MVEIGEVEKTIHRRQARETTGIKDALLSIFRFLHSRCLRRDDFRLPTVLSRSPEPDCRREEYRVRTWFPLLIPLSNSLSVPAIGFPALFNGHSGCPPTQST